MKTIKRINSVGLADKLGLRPAATSFIFKPATASPRTIFEPHRSEMYTFALILRGTVELSVGLEHYNIQAPALVTITPDDIRHWKAAGEDISIVSIFFTEDFMISGVSNPLFLKDLPFYNQERYVTTLDQQECDALKKIFDLIESKVDTTDQSKFNSLQAMTVVALLEARSICEKQLVQPAAVYSQSHILAGKFKKLLAKDFIQQRAVSYYAEQLCISPKHLSQSVKEQTGRTAGEMIDELIGLEAKIRLQNVELNISQVAQQLNFPSATFFGKFFKRIYGISPLEYRKRIISKTDI